jgi:hypothetical protein
MKFLKYTALLAVTILLLIMGIGAAKENIWHHISKVIGPLDHELVDILNARLPLDAYVEVPLVMENCEKNPASIFLSQSGVIRYKSDCSIDLLNRASPPPIVKEKFYWIQARESSGSKIISKSIDGLDYVVTFRATVKSNPFAILLGSGEDTVKAFEGKFKVRFIAPNPILNPSWELVGDIEHVAKR